RSPSSGRRTADEGGRLPQEGATCLSRMVKAKGYQEMGKPWGSPTTWDEVCRRAAGRRHYHAMRRLWRDLRRRKVVKLLARHGLGHGVRARVARELGVSEATVSRDVRAILTSHAPCPCCGRLAPRGQVEQYLKGGARPAGR